MADSLHGPREPRFDPLFRKAPLVLIRYPALLASLVLGSALIALSAAAYPLFISASASDLLASEIAKPTVTPYLAGLSYSRSNIRFDAAGLRRSSLIEELRETFDGQLRRSSLLGRRIEYVLGPVASISTPSRDVPVSGPISGRLFAATDAVAHLEVISGSAGEGVLIPDQIAEVVGVGPGDRIVLSNGRRSVDVAVGGVYRSLYRQPRVGFWLRWSAEIYEDPLCHGCPPPPQPMFVDRPELVSLGRQLGVPWATFGWLAPLRSRSLSWDQSLQLESFTGRVLDRMSDRRTYLGRLFECCQTYYAAKCCAFRSETALVSSIDSTNVVVRRRISMLESPGRLLQGAGVFVSLLVIAAAGFFGHSVRRVEAALLVSRGSGPSGVAARSVLEAAIPCAVGGSVGLVLAFLLVDLFGPAGPLSGSAKSAAVTGAVIATLASLVALGVVSAFAYLTSSEGHRPRARWLARIPAELPIAAVGLVGIARIASRTGGPAPAELTPSAGLATLIFTTLLFVGAGLAAARGFRALFVSVRNRSDRLPPGPYLAAHRLGRARALTLLLMAASVVCLGIFAESQTMVASLRATVDAKAKVYVGSDVQGRVDYRTPLPGSFPMPLTRVTRLLDAGELSDGRTFDLLAVDPETFAAAAFWKDSFASRSLEKLMRGLEGPTRGSLPVAAVRAGAFPRRATMRISGRTLPVEVVARARAFPGMTSLRPLLVVAEGPLLRAFPTTNPLDTTRGSTEFWVRGDQSRASDLLTELRYPPFLVLTADEVKDIPTFIAVIDTFLVLGVLGAAAALLVFAGTLMYLQARQRSQLVSYGLATRMGMTPETHRRALVLEFGALLGSSYAVGVGLAVVAALFVVPLLDPLSTIPPNPLLSLPVVSLALAFAAAAAATFAGGWFTNRTIQRFDLGEVMRVAE